MKFSIQGVYNWYRNLLRNPKYRWWVVLGTLIYFISPIDLVPDILFPGIGELDDVFLLTLMVSEVSQLVIEGFKARKGNTNENTSNSSTATNASAETVDVDAVSVN